ncbi:M1 family metallopeptidase [Candidatus Saccharibacteria bacterium]|nr:M1 family metallopeptidase [Candidatus Saccharibacteria bacterium]
MERLLKYFVPEKYILDLYVDKFKKTIGGEVKVLGKALEETIKFHAVDLEISDVLVNGEKATFKANGEILEVYGVLPGEVEVTIYYSGTLNGNMEGAYLSSYEYEGKEEIIVATQFESHYAREAFVCIDEPAAKAVFELSITTSEEDMVLSNMPEDFTKSHFGHAQGRSPRLTVLYGTLLKSKTTTFQPTPRMSTYLLAFVIGKFHGKTVVNKHGTEITTYAALNQDIDAVDFANEIAARSLEFFDDNFGVSYPLEKLDQVALPDFEAGAMENWGLVTYRESMLLVGKSATLGDKKSVAVTVAHELSHQWFGDLVTMEWWDDLWLNESFATVMEYFAVDFIHPEYKIFESFFTGDCIAALTRDACSGVQSVHQDVKDPAEIATLFDAAIVYAKGARLILMLIRAMGWKAFCKGLADYFEKFKYKNTVGDDLWASLKPYADFDPKALIHAFIDKPGYPVVKNVGGDFKEFSQKRFLLDGPLEDEEWPLPEISEDMSGHYILDLSDEEFAARIRDFDRLGLEEKLRLLIDRDLITRAGIRSSASLVPLLLEFKNEDTAAVWNKISGLVGNLEVYFDEDSKEEKVLKRYVYKLINEKLSEVGIVTGDGDDADRIKLRANLMGLDYFAEDVDRFRELAKMYRENPVEMDNEIRDDILAAKIYLEPNYVGEFIKKYKEISDPDIKFDYLSAACLVRDEEEVLKLVGLLGDFKTVKPQDQLYLFIYLYRNPKARKKVWVWLKENWEFVKKSGGDKTLSDYPMIIARIARTKEELEEYLEFFGAMRDDPAVSRAVLIGEREIKARLRLIERFKGGVLSALEGLE